MKIVCELIRRPTIFEILEGKERNPLACNALEGAASFGSVLERISSIFYKVVFKIIESMLTLPETIRIRKMIEREIPR